LIASLKAACASFDRGNFNAGMHQLEAFQHKVNVQVGRSDPAAAAAFNACAQRILDAIDCAARHGNNGLGNGQDPQPPGNPPINDGPGTSPGNGGNNPNTPP
jgi:hypothetical protein